MPALGFGTWNIGGKLKRSIPRDDESDIKAIQAAIRLGITHIDTAEAYNDNCEIFAETLIGKAIAKLDRSKLFLVSKVSFDFSYDGILKAAEESLKRLQVNYLDLYLLHHHETSVPLKTQMKALDRLVREGLVRSIGVSNFLPSTLQEGQSLASNKIVCNQVQYNLIFREPESSGLLEYCQNNDIFLVAWRPIGNVLSTTPCPVLKTVALKYNKTIPQISINWLISQDYVVTIFKARGLEHIKENLGALGWNLDKEDIELLRKDFPNQQFISNPAPLG